MIRKFVLSFAAVWWIAIASYADTTKVLVLRTGNRCDVERDIVVNDTTPYSGKGAIPWVNSPEAATHNLAVFNAAFDQVGHGTGQGGDSGDGPPAIYDPIYISGKTFYSLPGWVIARVGGSLLTGGGYQYDWWDGQRGLGLGSLTKIVFVGGSNDTPCVSYQTYGWKFGIISFWAYRVGTLDDANAEFNGTLAPRRAVCFDINGTYTAVGGLRSEGMYFDGFTDAIHFSATVINGDRCHWDYLGMRYCNNLIHCENEQSVFDSVGHAESYSTFDYMFMFDHGGDFTVTDSCTIEGGAGGTVLYVGQGSANMPRFTIHGLGVDNTALWAGSMKMVEFGNSLDYAAVRIDGKYDYDYSRGHDLTGGNSDDYDSGVSPIKINSVTGGNDGIHYSVHLDVTGISPTTAAAYPR